MQVSHTNLKRFPKSINSVVNCIASLVKYESKVRFNVYFLIVLKLIAHILRWFCNNSIFSVPAADCCCEIASKSIKSVKIRLGKNHFFSGIINFGKNSIERQAHRPTIIAHKLVRVNGARKHTKKNP